MIYADYNASAPLTSDVKEYLFSRLASGPFANPGSLHYLGRQARLGMENSRKICAKILGARTDQVIFNSGASEGITTVFHSIFNQKDPKDSRNIFIISGIEHPAIFNNADKYEKKGFVKKVLPTLKNGVVDLETLKAWLNDFGERVIFTTVTAANNETGVIQPYVEISKLCKENNIPFLTDSTQYIGKLPFNFNESGADFAVLSGHKLGALPGAGVLLAKNPTLIEPLILGGGQESGLRAGTQNYLAYETIAVALTNLEHGLEKISTLNKMRDLFESKIETKFPEIVILGKLAQRVPGTTSLSYPGTHGQAVQIELESKEIYITTSSACSDNEPVTSNVLISMGINDIIGRGVIRIGLGSDVSKKSYDELFTALLNIYEKLTKISSY